MTTPPINLVGERVLFDWELLVLNYAMEAYIRKSRENLSVEDYATYSETPQTAK